MAANKFATMLHRNTNKITLILVYAVLEWILIILILLNSLFSYLILKFADYFGLKRPCLWCSRLDHIFEPGKSKKFHRDLVCEAHATEISNLGYCLNHRKLAESQDMCEDCSSSAHPPETQEWSRKFAFFTWMKQIGMIKDANGGGGDEVENGEENSSCSCCGVRLSSRFYSPPCILIKPSWDVLDYTQKQNLVLESGIDDAPADEVVDHSDQSRSESATDRQDDEQGVEAKSRNQLASDGDVGKAEAEAEAETEDVLEFGCREIAGEEEEVEEESEIASMVVEKEQVQAVPNKEEEMHISMDDHQACEQSMIQQVGIGSEDTSSKIAPPASPPLEFLIGRGDCRLIPVGLGNSSTTKNQHQHQHHHRYKIDESERSGNLDLILDFDMNVKKGAEPVGENWHCSSDKGKEVTDFSVFEPIGFFQNSRISVIHEAEGEGEDEDEEQEQEQEQEQDEEQEQEQEGDIAAIDLEQVAIAQATQTPSENDDNEEIGKEYTAIQRGGLDSDFFLAFEDDANMRNDETDAEISIGTEIPDHDPMDEIHTQEFEHPSYSCAQDEPSTSSINLHVDDNLDLKQAEDELVEFKTLSVETSTKEINNHLALYSELEEEKIPDTPTSIDSLQMLYKKLFLLERRESGTEESLDGSVMSDIDGGGDGVLTVEKLKSALRAERKTLNALYAELEEERSASAVAANQTMAMINRLQEEKAAMQMEALQYQRMMEEQSEYDQEALQLLNELMVKREKEKQELEKELELYRRKVQDYEAKEKMMMLRRMKESSTRSCSNAEDSDGLSVDLNSEVKEEYGLLGHEEIRSNQNTPADAVLYLEESLASFEEERVSILDQLRVLEEKLFTLSDEDHELHFEDIKPIENLYQENGNGYHHENFDLSKEVVNGIANGHSKEMNGKNHQQESRFMASKAKRLLPLFDAIEAETEDVLNGNGKEFDYVALHNSSVIEFETDNKKLAIEEEVDHVYERLQALEADREFLKHCISSLRKGDKGVELLQEILQHLRDLRSVELRVKNMGDGVL